MLNLKHRAVGLLAVGFFACILMGMVHSFTSRLLEDLMLLVGADGLIVYFLEPILSAAVAILVFVLVMNNFLSKDLSQPSRFKNTFITYFGIWAGLNVISMLYPLIWEAAIGNRLIDARLEFYQAFDKVHYLVQLIFSAIVWDGKYLFALIYFLIKMKSFADSAPNHPPIPQKG